MAQYPFFFEGGLPFCPYVLTQNDINNWDFINKGAWLEFDNFNAVIELYWRPKTLKVQGFNSAPGVPTSLFWQGSPFEWDGSSWQATPDINDDVYVYYEASTPILNLTAKKDDLFSDPTDSNGFPNDFVCGGSRYFRGSVTGTDINHDVEIVLFFYTRPDIAGGFSDIFNTHPLLYDPFSQKYYVGIEYNWTMNISDDTWPAFSNNNPPPPSVKYARSGGNRDQYFNGSSGDNSNDVFTDLNIPCVVTIAGSTVTLYLDNTESTAGNADDESFTVEIADTFPYFDSDS